MSIFFLPQDAHQLKKQLVHLKEQIHCNGYVLSNIQNQHWSFAENLQKKNQISKLSFFFRQVNITPFVHHNFLPMVILCLQPLLKWRHFLRKIEQMWIFVIYPNFVSLSPAFHIISAQLKVHYATNNFKTAVKLFPSLCYQGSKGIADELKDTVES